jgi:hypothetical protein
MKEESTSVLIVKAIILLVAIACPIILYAYADLHVEYDKYQKECAEKIEAAYEEGYNQALEDYGINNEESE